jgi:hypothetical protein
MKYYAFDEPVDGFDPDKDCNQTIVMSEADAISYWRNTAREFIRNKCTDAEVLDDFIVVNWAYEVELIKKEQAE